MNAHNRIPLHDRLGADSPCDHLDDTISLTHLLLMAAETCRGDDGRAIYQGVAQILDRLRLLREELMS